MSAPEQAASVLNGGYRSGGLELGHMAPVADKLPAAAAMNVPVRSVPWTAIVWFAALLILGSFPILKHLVDVGQRRRRQPRFLGPAWWPAWIAWQRRERILAMKSEAGLVGLGDHGVGHGARIYRHARRRTVPATHFRLDPAGGLVADHRWDCPGAGAWRFPLLLLPFMIPIPGVIYNRITFPLQLFASSGGGRQLWICWVIRCCATATSWSWPVRSFPWRRPAAGFAACCRCLFCRWCTPIFSTTESGCAGCCSSRPFRSRSSPMPAG